MNIIELRILNLDLSSKIYLLTITLDTLRYQFLRPKWSLSDPNLGKKHKISSVKRPVILTSSFTLSVFRDESIWYEWSKSCD